MKLLQQGRGAGFLAALEAGSRASADVLDCVLHDPRWDRQVESRDEYYGQLLLAAGTDIEPLRRSISEESSEADESDFWLPIGVLVKMSRRGSDDASAALAQGVASGAQWRACLERLEAAGGMDLVSRVVRAEAVERLLSRVGVEEIVEAVEQVAAPWERWAETVPALRFVMGEKGADASSESRPLGGNMAGAAHRLRGQEMPEDLAALPTESLLLLCSSPGAVAPVSKELSRRTDPEARRLLESAADVGTPQERNAALRALGRQGFAGFVGAAEEFLRRESTLALTDRRDIQGRLGFLRYLEELPPAISLPLARAWFLEDWPLSRAAEKILAKHAAPDDRPVLIEAGAAALESSDMYRLCSIVDALATAGPEDALPLLSEIYEQTSYSYARLRVVSAMARSRGIPDAHRYLEEALWDCESDARAVACRAVDPTSAVSRTRIQELASDRYETEAVTAAARGALQGR